MANQTVNVDLGQLKQMAGFVEAIDVYREKLEELKKNFFLSLPETLAEKILPEGSSLWWEREIALGEKEIEKGGYKAFKNAKSLIKDLH